MTRGLLATAVALAASLAGAAPASPQAAVPLPVEGARPADVVARLAHEALASPSTPDAWKQLAGALPDLALKDGADLETTFEAARLADSLASPTAMEASASHREQRGVRAMVAGIVGALSGLPGGRVGALWLVGIGVLAVTLVVVRRRPRASTHPREASGNGRLWTARTLAGGGAELREIARRTGMAQEAVDLALRLTGRGAVTVPAGAHPKATRRTTAPSRRSRSSVDARARRMHRELVHGVRDLRDGRLTYGGSVR